MKDMKMLVYSKSRIKTSTQDYRILLQSIFIAVPKIIIYGVHNNIMLMF